MSETFVLSGVLNGEWQVITVSDTVEGVDREFMHYSQEGSAYSELRIDAFGERDRTMTFWDAVRAMDQGHIVRMCVNPERFYRLAKDGVTYVSRPIYGDFIGCDPGEWQNAVFFSRHVVGDWCICDGEVPIDGTGEEAEE